jgi:hypothetical protein
MGTWAYGLGLERFILRLRSSCAGITRLLNVMDAVNHNSRLNQAKLHHTVIMYSDNQQEALKERKKFEQAFRHNAKAVKTVIVNWRG